MVDEIMNGPVFTNGRKHVLYAGNCPFGCSGQFNKIPRRNFVVFICGEFNCFFKLNRFLYFSLD